MGKLTDKTALVSVDGAADYIPIVDVSDTSEAASGTGKKLLPNNLPVSTAAQTAFAKARLGVNNRDTYIYDDFDRSNRTLSGDTTPTGQVWVTTGPGAATVAITSGKLESSSNYYAYLDYGKAIQRIGGAFSLQSNSSTTRTTTSVTLIADAASAGLANMLHLIVGPDTWTLQKRISNGAFTEIASGKHNLRTDGTVYQVAMEINSTAGTVTVIAPNGTLTSVTDSDITTISPRYGCIQYLPAGTAAVGTWHAFYMTPTGVTASALRAIGGGAAATDMDIVFGEGGKLSLIESVVLTGAGWYRILTEDARITFAIDGELWIDAQDAFRVTRCHVDLSVYNADTTPVATQVGTGRRYQGGAITQVRVSTLNTTPFSKGVDINIPNGNAVTLKVWFRGTGVLVQSPTVGATALASGSTTLTLA